MKKIKNLLIGVALVLLATLIDKSISKEEKMSANSEWKKVLQWWGIVALLIVLLALLLGCRSASVRFAPADGTFVHRDSSNYETIAWTHCKNGEVKIRLKDGREWDELELSAAIVHERIHVAQFTANCAKTETLYNTFPKVRQSMELEAYCADSQYYILRGVPLYLVQLRLRQTMMDLYQLKDATCPQPP